MKLLLDENISATVTASLRDAGFSALHILEVGLGSASDEEIIAFARSRKLTVVTQDKDFGNLIRFPKPRHYGVILVRFRNQSPQNVFAHLLAFLKRCPQLASKLVILREDGARIIDTMF